MHACSRPPHRRSRSHRSGEKHCGCVRRAFQLSLNQPWWPLPFLPAACASKQIQCPRDARYVVAVLTACAFLQIRPGAGIRPGFHARSGPAAHHDSARASATAGVMTENGISGYVSNDDIKPAPPATSTPQKRHDQVTRLRPNTHRSSTPATSSPVPQPLFDVNDVPLPRCREAKAPASPTVPTPGLPLSNLTQSPPCPTPSPAPFTSSATTSTPTRSSPRSTSRSSRRSPRNTRSSAATR